MQRNNRTFILIVGALIVIAIIAVIFASNPKLLGTAGGEGSNSEIVEAPAQQPEAQQPEAQQPEAQQPEAQQPEAQQPEAQQPTQVPPTEAPQIVAQVPTEQPPTVDMPLNPEDPDGDGVIGSDDECPDQGGNVGGDGCPIQVAATNVPPTEVPPTATQSNVTYEVPPTATLYEVPPTMLPTVGLIPGQIVTTQTLEAGAQPPAQTLVAPPTLVALAGSPTTESGEGGAGNAGGAGDAGNDGNAGMDAVIAAAPPTYPLTPESAVCELPRNEDSGDVVFTFRGRLNGQAIAELYDPTGLVGTETLVPTSRLGFIVPRTASGDYRVVIKNAADGTILGEATHNCVVGAFPANPDTVHLGSTECATYDGVAQAQMWLRFPQSNERPPYRVTTTDSSGAVTTTVRGRRSGTSSTESYAIVRVSGETRWVVTALDGTEILTATQYCVAEPPTMTFTPSLTFTPSNTPPPTPTPTATPITSIGQIGPVTDGITGITGLCSPNRIVAQVTSADTAFMNGPYTLLDPAGRTIGTGDAFLVGGTDIFSAAVTNPAPGKYSLVIQNDLSGNTITMTFECSPQSVGQVAIVPTATPTAVPTDTPVPTATVDVQATRAAQTTATQNAINAQGTQVAINAQSTIDAFNAQQTQIANSLNATASVNANNSAATATIVAGQINATSTAVVANATQIALDLNATANANMTATQNAIATQDAVATATQIGVNAFAIATQVSLQQTQIVADLNATASANANNTGGTATAIVDQINATSTALAANATQIALDLNATANANMTATQNAIATATQGGANAVTSSTTQAPVSAAPTGVVTTAVPTTAPNVTPQGSVESGQCLGVTNAPPEVVAALDTVIALFTNTDNVVQGAMLPSPGAVIRVETPDWIYYEAMGLANVETGEPLRCDQPFQIGSNTKMMTATILLQLVEEGQLSLDDHLSDYLPDYASALPYGDQITLRELANHTSGIFNYTEDAPDGTPALISVNDTVALRQGYTPDELVQFAIQHGEPYFEPGAEGQFHYSNTNYVLLGLIIEKITGQDLGSLLKDRIFTPLGMDHTFLWNEIPLADFGLPQGYLQYPFDVNTSAWNMSQGWAAGGVISTADDMSTFIKALLNGELFQHSDTLTVMMETVNAAGLGEYGIGLIKKPTDQATWGHGGTTLDFESDVAYVPQANMSIVVWTNASSDYAVVGVPFVEQALVNAGVLSADQ